MPKKNPPTGTHADLTLASMAGMFSSENQAREFLEKLRWPNGPVCPHCGCCDIYTLKAKQGSKHPVPPGVYKCAACREKFTVRIGTVLEDSKLPIAKWLMAIHLMTSSKKGISSHQIARECGITQRSAWFLNHRIRKAMTEEPLVSMLQGTVEADETYVGGKPRKGTGKRAKPGRPDKDNERKTCVAVLVERDGSARVRPIEQVTIDNLRVFIEGNVSKDAKLHTDELPAYKPIAKDFAGHETVCHSKGEYSRRGIDGLVHCNTGESFFALLKRGHFGIFHKLSKKHLHRYCNEFGFRWNHRKVSDGERMVAAVKGIEGKRLMYKTPVGLAS